MAFRESDNTIKDFEGEIESLKKKGVEVVLAIQEFLIKSDRERLKRVWIRIGEYRYLFCRMRSTMSRDEASGLVRVNKTMKNIMRELNIEEVYLNILRSYPREIRAEASSRKRLWI